METTLFRFANDERYKSDTVFSTTMAVVGSLTAVFLLLIFGFIGPISGALGYTEHPDYLLMMAVVVALDAVQAIPFSYLRYQKRPLRFASLKMLFIILNIGLNLLYFVVLGKTSVFYVFFIRILRILHQSALHRLHHLLLPARPIPHPLEIRRQPVAQHAQLLVAYPDSRYRRYPEPGSRQDHLPAGLSRSGRSQRTAWHLRFLRQDSDDHGDDHTGFPLCL